VRQPSAGVKSGESPGKVRGKSGEMREMMSACGMGRWNHEGVMMSEHPPDSTAARLFRETGGGRGFA
jgi:hypothetical protein